jgi:hypothetical protein
MLLAYLEGSTSNLIHPEYPYGARSIWREHLILEAIQKKHLAQQILENLKNDTQFIPVLKLESIPEMATNLRKQVSWLNRILLMELNADRPAELNSEVKNLAKLYNTLEKSGILNEVSK